MLGAHCGELLGGWGLDGVAGGDVVDRPVLGSVLLRARKDTELSVPNCSDLRIIILELILQLLAVSLEALATLLLRRDRLDGRVAIARCEHVGRHGSKRKAV